MKHKLQISIIVFLSVFLFQGKSVSGSTQFIDLSDSVVFDLSMAVINGSNIDIPVSILSDDTVYALDFSMKFNHLNLSFDTIFNPTPYITSFYYYNPTDSTLRFTSYSIHQYANDSPLVVLRFTMLSSMIAGPDLYDMFSYLNGDTCSTKYIDLLPTSVQKISSISSGVKVFPNPAGSSVNLIVENMLFVSIYDIFGRLVKTFNTETLNTVIDVSGFPNGPYVIVFRNPAGSEESLKFFVQH